MVKRDDWEGHKQKFSVCVGLLEHTVVATVGDKEGKSHLHW